MGKREKGEFLFYLKEQGEDITGLQKALSDELKHLNARVKAEPE